MRRVIATGHSPANDQRLRAVGSAAGVATAVAIGRSKFRARWLAEGDSTALAIPEGASVGSAAPSSTAAAVSAAFKRSRGTAHGDSEALGGAFFRTGGTASASSTGVGVGRWETRSPGTAAPGSTATGVGKSKFRAAGTSAGSSTAAAVGVEAEEGAGSAAGVATAAAIGRWLMRAAGSAAPSSTAAGVGREEMRAAGSAAPSSTAAAVGGTAVPAVTQYGHAVGTTTANITWGSTTTTGHNLIVGVACRAPTSVTFTAPAGWTQLGSTVDLSFGSGPTQHLAAAIFYKENVAAQSSTGAFGSSGGTPTDFIAEGAEVANLKTSSSGDASASNSSSSSSSPDSGTTGTTAQAAEYWAAFLFQNAGAATFSSPTNSFTIQDQRDTAGTSTIRGAMLDKVVSSAGTANTGVSSTQTARYVGIAGTFKGA